MKIWLVNLSAEKASVPVIYSALPGWWVLRLWRVCVLSLFPAMTEVEKMHNKVPGSLRLFLGALELCRGLQELW